MNPLQLEAKRKAEVMLAYASGQSIQFLQYDTTWQEVTDPRWDWYSTDYRIKPRKFVAYMNIHECNGKLVAAGTFDSLEKAEQEATLCSHPLVKTIRIQEEI